jgi:hypothetical protein
MARKHRCPVEVAEILVKLAHAFFGLPRFDLLDSTRSRESDAFASTSA